MFVTPSILFLLSPDVTPFAVLGFGCLMLVAITLFHGAGLDRIVSLYKGKSQKCLQSPWHPLMAQYFFGWTILLLLLLHLVDTTIWALVLNLTDLVPNIHESFYFSANTYTTLGYGNVPLPHAWRELSPIMAISGLFTFAWTTAQMFNLVGIHHDIVEEMSLNYHKRKELRRVERGQVQLVRTEEYEGGESPRRAREAGGSWAVVCGTAQAEESERTEAAAAP